MNHAVTAGLAVACTVLASCAPEPRAEAATPAPAPAGPAFVVVDTTLPDVFDAAATVEPLAEAVLATRLMARVSAVHAREGEHVVSGALLVQLDSRELDAKRVQVDAGIRSAEAVHHEAVLQAGRIRALFADSAAPRAQLDAAEAGLARTEQGLRAAQAAAAELEAVADYAAIRAPFAGTVTQRFVDPGAFASPGSPLVRIEDATRLRVVAAMPPVVAGGVSRGDRVAVTIEGHPAMGIVEGVVPASGAALSLVQVLVDNRDGHHATGSAAIVSVAGALRRALVIPTAAVLRDGDLTGVRVRGPDGATMRWVRLGRVHGAVIEVLSGLSAGDTIVAGAPAEGA